LNAGNKVTVVFQNFPIALGGFDLVDSQSVAENHSHSQPAFPPRKFYTEKIIVLLSMNILRLS